MYLLSSFWCVCPSVPRLLAHQAPDLVLPTADCVEHHQVCRKLGVLATHLLSGLGRERPLVPFLCRVQGP